MDRFTLLLVIFALAAPIAAYYIYCYHNRVIVNRPDKAQASYNPRSKEVDILREGLHFLPPGTKLMDEIGEVDLSVIPVTRTDKDKRELVRAQGVDIEVSLTYVYIFGRKFDDKTGELLQDIKDFDDIDNEQLKKYLIKTDNALGQLEQVIAKVMENEFSHYDPTLLLTGKPAKPGAPCLPLTMSVSKIKDGEKVRVDEQAKTLADIRTKLAKTIEVEVNYKLRKAGYNIVNFEIVGLNSASETLQKDLHKEIENLALARGAKALQDQMSELSDREAVAPRDQFGTVTLAESLRELKEAVKDGIKAGLQALAGKNKPPT